jgi:hypothetical protein
LSSETFAGVVKAEREAVTRMEVVGAAPQARFTRGSSPNDKLTGRRSEHEKRGGTTASQHRKHRQPVVAAALILASASIVSAATSATPASLQPPSWTLHGRYSPTIDPRNFVTGIDNRYFPLVPGASFHYRGFRGTSSQTDDMVVTYKVKDVLGVRCTVVEDTVSEGGKPIERTFDWYAQDKHGNVWYMGEDSLELKNGHFVRADDSWEAGVKGAKPGIIMEGNPRQGDVYRQEYYPPGGALDQGRVFGRYGVVRVPVGTFKHALVTVEWSPVEPQLEKKVYVAGLGEVTEEVIQGGHEGFRLVKVTH